MTHYKNLVGALVVLTTFFLGALSVSAGNSGDVIPTNANAYFVSPSGNDSNSGKSPSSAWRTLSKVNSSVNTTGADVYLLAGGFRAVRNALVAGQDVLG